MAKTFDAFRIVLDECSIDEWKKRTLAVGQYFREYAFFESIVIELATIEYRKPYKVEVYKNISRFYTYVDIYFDFVTEQEQFKFRLAGKGEELQKKLSQRIMNSEELRPIKVIYD